MKLLKIVILVTSMVFSGIISADEMEDSDTISFAELPAPIQRSFQDIAKVEMILEIELEEESESISCYEISIKEGDLESSYIFTQDGALIEIKKSIDFNQLPDITRKLLQQEFPKLEIEELEEVQEFSYELEGTIDGETVQIEISNDGDIEFEDVADEGNEEIELEDD